MGLARDVRGAPSAQVTTWRPAGGFPDEAPDRARGAVV